jgi:hypothetical protein
MNLLKIIDNLDLEKIDHEEFLKPAMRRGLFKKASDFTLKAALASVPFAMMALPRIVKANTSDANTDVLNFALTLEYLEAEFYSKGIAASGLIPTSDSAIFMQISKHETDHVAFLKGALGAAAVAKPTFDFTGGNAGGAGGAVNPAPFADVFTNYQTFLAISQGLEDTGVRAYKGQAGNITNKTYLTYALQIHSVEARHASEVRRLRGQNGWISQKTTDVVALQAVYNGEENTTQGGVDITQIPSLAGFTLDNLTEAFDEPLDMVTVLSIANNFIVH